MCRIIGIVLVTFISGYLFSLCEPVFGIIAAIAVMGGFIVNEIQKNK